MNIIEEVNCFSNTKDKPILLWLFKNYHMASQWRFVANCTFGKYSKYSYQSNRIWKPTREGLILYHYNKLIQSIETEK